MSWFSKSSSPSDPNLGKNLKIVAGVLDKMEERIGGEELEKFSYSTKGDDATMKFELIELSTVAGREKKNKKVVALRISSHLHIELLVDGSHVFYIPVDPKTSPVLYQRLKFHRKRAVETVEAKNREKKEKAELSRITIATEREKSVVDRINEIFS